MSDRDSVACAVFDSRLHCVRSDVPYARLVLGTTDPARLVGLPFVKCDPGLALWECRRVGLILQAADPQRQVHLHVHPGPDARMRLWQFSYARARVAGESGLSVAGLDVTDRARTFLDGANGPDRDTLAGLAGPAAFESAVEVALRRYLDGASRPGLLLVDISACVDAYGDLDPASHSLLVLAASRRVRNSLRGNDIVSRVRRHRFAVLCPDSVHGPAIADRLRHLLTRLFETAHGQEAITGLRIGAAAPLPGEDVQQLMSRVRSAVEADPLSWQRADVVDLRSQDVESVVRD